MRTFPLSWLLLLPALAIAEPDPPIAFDMIVPTQQRNPHRDDKGHYDRVDPNRLRIRAVPAGDINRVIDDLRATPGVVPEPETGGQPKVYVYIRADGSPERKKQQRAAAERLAEKQFPGRNPKVIVTELSDIDPAVIHTATDAQITALAAKMPDDQVTRDGIAAMRKANDEALETAKEAQALKKTFMGRWAPEELDRRDDTPPRLKKTFKMLSVMRSAVIAGGNTYQTWPGLISGDPVQVAAGATLPVLNAGVEFYGAAFEIGLGKTFMGERPAVDKAKHPFLARLAALAPTARGTAISIGVWGFARPTVVNSYMHLATAGQVGLFTTEDYAKLGAINLFSSGVYFLTFGSIEKLRQKGLVTANQAKQLLRGPGVLWPFLNIAFQFPEGSTVKKVAPFLGIPIWTIWATTAAFGELLSPRNNHYVLVDSALDNDPEVAQRHALEYVQDVPGHDQASLRAAAETSLKAPPLFGEKKKTPFWLRCMSLGLLGR